MPQKIRTSLIARGLSLAKITASQLLSPSTSSKVLLEELGRLKGSAMKIGQTLSMYGEYILPQEMTELLKTLQQNAPPLSWEPIEQVLKAELGEEKLARLEISQTAAASASIGQVHRARERESGRALVLKVQYPGVDAAVESDLKIFKLMLKVSHAIPRGPRFDQIFEEVRTMFYQELDYRQEAAAFEKFRRYLHDDARDGDERYVVPSVWPEFSTSRVLALDYAPGLRVDAPEIQSWPLEKRNRLGAAYYELYMRELLEFQLVQTDPHLGNYAIQDERLVLFDFGAVREVPAHFLTCYRQLILGGLNGDDRLIEKAGRALGLLQPEDSLELVADYVQLCRLIMEPFQPGPEPYDWGASDLPKRVAKAATHILKSYRLRAPPRELVFLDRKLGGVFLFLSTLKCKMDVRPILERALDLTKGETTT